MWLRYWGKLINDYSAMQWPCPAGFHIPTINEINTMYSYMNTLWLTNTWLNFKEKLLLPNSSRLKQQTWTRENVNYSYLLTCNSAANGSASGIRIAQTSIYTWNNWTLSKSGWHSIRPFRDTPVTPDSSWTTIYDWSSVATWAGVFHNSTLWLISLSGDWTNRLTIADKNLWATQVWNPWDTLTSANAGKYYQRWNNYWFDMTWATTTSSTKVDASAYWPWNYYSSSTFITDGSSSVKAWDTTINTNLRWWTTWIQQKPAPIVKRYYGWKLVNDYSAMRWPAPDGFHVPLSTERQAVYNIWTALWWWSSDWTNFWIALKLPFAGYRSYSYAGVNNQNSDANYWSSTPGNSYSAYRLYFKSSRINRMGTSYRSNANSVRCFKNSPTMPTSSWTKLYWTSIEAGGIFWSSTDWLISLSSDWQTRITIQDKNLWATQVWNSWDTLSEANCGKYYQRWNNYGFPRTWSVTTSSVQVDASNYWPWNYYNSSTFITRSSSPYTWDSTDNWNLWWWETWVQQKPAEVIKVYKWNIQIRPVVPVPRAEFTDWDEDVLNAISEAFEDTWDDLYWAIEFLFSETFVQYVESELWSLSSWTYDWLISGWTWLEISNWWDMVDISIQPQTPFSEWSAAIVWNTEDYTHAELITWTYNSSDDNFYFEFSSLASDFSGENTAIMFIFEW